MPATLPASARGAATRPDDPATGAAGTWMAAGWLAWLTWILALGASSPMVPVLWKIEPSLVAAGPGGALILGALAVLAPRRFAPWSAALWAVLGLMGTVSRLADAGPGPILGMPPETALVALLGLVYAIAAGYVVACPLLDVRMKGCLLLLGAWGASAVPLGLSHGLTLWDLVRRGANPLAGTLASPYTDPTFIGVNAFLICAVAAGLFDLFSRLVQRDWPRVATLGVLVLTLFAAERYLLDRYDARGLPSFRTVVRDAVRAPETSR